MTEKVKVTPKMDELIRNTLKKYKRHEIVEKYNSIACDYKNEIDLDTLIKALYIGYEVEEDFKENDWVVPTGNGFRREIKPYQILRIDDFKVWLDCELWVYKSGIRPATPSEIAEEKERRFFARHGREPWELKIEDVLVDTDGEIKEVTSANVKTNGTVQYCIDYCAYSLDHIKERFIILVFKENRLDVKLND